MIQEELSMYRSQMTKQSMRFITFAGSRESYRLSKALPYAVAHARKIVPQMDKDQIVVITISDAAIKTRMLSRVTGSDLRIKI